MSIFGNGKMFKKKKANHDGTERIIVKENSMSSKVDGYNRLKDNILYLNTDGNTKVIQVESSVQHEGKTTVLCNLAVALGFTNKKVIVVDLDFRKPRVQQRFGISIDCGIAEFMLGTAEKKDIIKHAGEKYGNIDIITRGGKIYNSSLILVSDKFKKLIAELREEYDYVLLDCAPVLQVSDYIHISQVSDGVLFLVAYAATTRNQVLDAVKELKLNGARILGSVFTMYDRKKDKGYGYYGKGYYGKGYYSYYRSYLEEEDTERKKKQKSKTEKEELKEAKEPVNENKE